MTQAKLKATLPSGPIDSATAGSMWRNLGGHYMAIVELRVTSRTEPDGADDVEPTCQLTVDNLELAQGEDDDEQLRQALKARWRARTAAGTLDADTGAARVGDDVDGDVLAAVIRAVQDRGTVGGLPATAEWARAGRTVDLDSVTITVHRAADGEHVE